MERVTYIKIKQSAVFVGVKIVMLTLFLLLFWWLRNWLVSFLGSFMSVDLLTTITGKNILWWISVLVYAYLLFQVLVQWYTIVYEVFSDRIVISKGLIRKNKFTVSLEDFSQFQQYQSIVGRILNYGTIEFMYRTIGPAGGFGETFYNIDNPDVVVAQLRSLMQLKDKSGKESLVEQKKNESVVKGLRHDAEVATVVTTLETSADSSDNDNTSPEQPQPVQDATPQTNGDGVGGVDGGDISGEIQF